MKKLIFKDNDVEVFKTNNKVNPYILELENEEIARFDCQKDENIVFALPLIFESLLGYLESQKGILNDHNVTIDQYMNIQVKKALYFH